jgi:hypothetical protein
MNRLSAAWIALLVGGVGTASAFPSVEVIRPNAIELVANFEGPIPTEANPITGEKRLARMRREGKLPDSFVRGRCTYNLAGDPAAAYYVKECR